MPAPPGVIAHPAPHGGPTFAGTEACKATVNLASIPKSYWRAYLAGYGDGVQYGVARALADEEAAEDGRWADLSHQVRKQAASPRFSQLADRRGDHNRAERARRWERANGLGTVA